MAEPDPLRADLAKDDLKLLMEDVRFRRFLSTIRELAGIEVTAYGPEERHLHFMEGRRSLWCNILLAVQQVAGADAILRILEAEFTALKGTPNGRKSYDRLRIDDGDTKPGRARRAEPDPDFLDYGTSLAADPG